MTNPETAKHRANKRFLYLFLAGFLIVVPISLYYAMKVRVSPGAGASTMAKGAALTDSSFGPVRVGMTLSQLAAAIGPIGDTTRLRRSCDIVSASDPYRMPPGVSITQVNGIVSRIDIENDSIATDKGVRVGDSEDKVKKLYGAGVIVEPHKYIDGHYLEIKSGTDSATAKGIVFETDGTKVTTFRAGYWDPVRWVEGCA